MRSFGRHSWALWFPFLDVVVLDPWQERRREIAASIQEQFDCEVLDTPWNDALAGANPSVEDIHEAATAYVVDPRAPLEDWYPVVVDALPLYQSRLICQRTNCWWDSKLRRRYSTVILGTLGAVSITVVALGLINGMTLEKLILAVIAPLSPAVQWGIREVYRQRDAAASLDRLKDHGRQLLDRLVAGTLTEGEASSLSRQLQDAILVRRRENPFVFDWIYRLLRKQYEEQMNVGAQAMVDEIRA
jgi:hypothetical protein